MAQLLSQVAAGNIVTIKENGSAIQFYIMTHNYESRLNGEGRTAVIRRSPIKQMDFDSDESHSAFENSDLDLYFNGDYKESLAPEIREAIGQTKFYTPVGNGNISITTLSRGVFPPSMKEMGINYQYSTKEGTASPAASTIVSSGNGYWSRSLYTEYGSGWGSIWVIYRSDSYTYRPPNDPQKGKYARPMFTLPHTAIVLSDNSVVMALRPPSAINVPSSILVTKSISISYSAVSEADSYKLERQVDGGNWTTVYTGANTSYSDAAQAGWGSVVYRVSAGILGVYGDTTQSSAVTITTPEPPASITVPGAAMPGQSIQVSWEAVDTGGES